MEGISISLDKVSETAGTLRTINKNISTKLDEIKKEMTDLSNYWQSEAAETIISRFNAYSLRFQDYFSVVDSYANFLDYTVTRYDTEETTINSNASAFQ